MRTIFTLGDAGSIAVGTLGDGGVTEAGATLGTVLTGLRVLARSRNIRDNVASASACSGCTVAMGAAGVGFCRACTRSCAATMAASAEDVPGMLPSCREKSAVCAMRSYRVLVMHVRWHW